MPSKLAPRIAALALTLLALALRWGRGSDWWYNPDEGIFWSMASSASLAELNAFLVARTAHPPAFSYLLHLLAQVRDDLDWLRMPAFVAGVLLVPLGFFWGRALGNLAAGVVAGLVLALSPMLIEQSDLIRPYTLQIVALLAALYALERYRSERGLWALVAYAGATSLAILIHYGSVVALAPIGVMLGAWWLRGTLDRRSVVALAVAQLPVLAALGWILFVHVFPVLLGGTLEANVRELWLPDQYASGPVEALRLVGVRLASAMGPGVRGPLPLWLLGLGVVLAGARGKWDIVLLSASAVFAAVALSWAGLYPLGHTRHSLYLVPFLVLPIATGVGSLLEHRRIAVRILGVLLLAMLCFQQARSLVRVSATIERWGSGERVVTRETARAIHEHLLQASHENGLVLTDEQTFRLLQPLFGLDAGTVRSVPGAEALRQVAWRELEIVYPRGWSVIGMRTERESEFHLERVLDALAVEPDYARRLRAGPVWFIQGGWQPPFALGLPRRDAAGREIWGSPFGGRGLVGVRFHPEAYRAYLDDAPSPP